MYNSLFIECVPLLTKRTIPTPALQISFHALMALLQWSDNENRDFKTIKENAKNKFRKCIRNPHLYPIFSIDKNQIDGRDGYVAVQLNPSRLNVTLNQVHY